MVDQVSVWQITQNQKLPIVRCQLEKAKKRCKRILRLKYFDPY